MIESVMVFGIGFLVASLFGLVLVPLVHNRAVRLTMKRLEAATPLSMAEIQADKDQLRAEFAMSTRRLEMSVDQLKSRTTLQLSEIGKKTDAINRLKIELGEKTATIFALEARERSLRDQIRTTEQEIAHKTAALHDVERALSDRNSELEKLSTGMSEQTVTNDSQRIEIVALRTQVEALRGQVATFENDLKDAERRLASERADAEAATKELAEEHGKVENLGVRITQLERQLMVQTTEAEILGRRVHDLEQRIAEQGRSIIERDYELNRLRAQVDAARTLEADLRAEIAQSTAENERSRETILSEKSVIEKELAREREQRGKLQLEISSMKRDAETTWATERVENALLRERINDIAAEVARLTATLEGPGSSIDAIIAEPGGERAAINGGGAKAAGAATEIAGATAEVDVNGKPIRSNLAERIRALQSRASSVAPVA